mmetsp:Transcript_115316/g.274100  ORF Transcript_115316/g.274100 Transcript_115316/m.274100 type:complete len:99 (+) Transcript_115316:254-550(+)
MPGVSITSLNSCDSCIMVRSAVKSVYTLSNLLEDAMNRAVAYLPSSVPSSILGLTAAAKHRAGKACGRAATLDASTRGHLAAAFNMSAQMELRQNQHI